MFTLDGIQNHLGAEPLGSPREVIMSTLVDVGRPNVIVDGTIPHEGISDCEMEKEGKHGSSLTVENVAVCFTFLLP